MRSGQQGFTLIEIMVVMVILSFGLVAVVGAAAQAARSTSAIEELESLRQAAEQVLATQVIQAQIPRERSEGTLGRIVVRVMPDGFQFIGTRARAKATGFQINTGTIIRAAACCGVYR